MIPEGDRASEGLKPIENMEKHLETLSIEVLRRLFIVGRRIPSDANRLDAIVLSDE